MLTSQAHLPSPPFANVHGLAATGKSSILRAYLHLAQIPHKILNVRECITTRHLLECIVAASLDGLEEAFDEKIDRRPYTRTENLSALCVNLQKMMEGRSRFVLVLDAIDKLRESGGTLIAALGRLGETVRRTSCMGVLITHTEIPGSQSRPHRHDDPTHFACSATLPIDTLHRLSALHPPTAPHHPRQKPPQGLPHSTFCG